MMTSQLLKSTGQIDTAARDRYVARMTTRKTAPLLPASPIASTRVGTRLHLTYPPGTTLGQVGEIGHDYVRRVWVDGQRWVVEGFEDGVAKCWSEALRAA